MIKFGTDGWRALMSSDFTSENVAAVAVALAQFLGSTKDPVVIGYDNRLNSENFAKTAADKISSWGIKVLLSNSSCPTPAVSFHVVKNKAAAGVMITASHNPPQWNGFKIKGSYGGSASPEITKSIENILNSKKNNIVPEIKPSSISKLDPKKYYLDAVKTKVDLELISKAKIKIIVDPMFGSGIGYVSEALKGVAEVKEINNHRDTNFGGINPEPIAKNLGKLLSECKDLGLSGIALDGDSDRVGASRTDGVYINTHQIFALLLYHLAKNKKMTGEIVKTFNMSCQIDRMCDKFGFKLNVTPIGFKYICDLMLKKDILLGGEESGGMGFKDHIPERDAVLASLYLIELMACEKKNLDQILEKISNEFGYFYYNRIDLHIEEDRKKKFVSLMDTAPPSSLCGHKVKEIQKLDGTKLIFGDGSWILFRASGTEPLLRIYCEAASTDRVNEFLDAGCKLAK